MTNPITTINRERLVQLADENTICKVSWDERIEMSRALLEVMDANPAPVWGQARFKGGDWASCSAEHAAMVMANPEEWGDYECRYLYTTPPASTPPDGWIKCSERMPDDDTLCLGCDLDGVMWTLHFDEGQLMPDIGELSSAITHWMPLPAAPGGD
jgi:hypothetical protein